jgi:hypothetical protein
MVPARWWRSAQGSRALRSATESPAAFFQRWSGGEPPANVQANALGGGIDGMLAEFVMLEEEGVAKVPAHLSVEERGTLPCAGVTAWHALIEHGKLVAGRTALLQGTGGVSTDCSWRCGLLSPSRAQARGSRRAPVATRKGAELRCNPMLPLFSLVFDGTSKCTTREAGLRHDIVLFGRSK